MVLILNGVALLWSLFPFSVFMGRNGSAADAAPAAWRSHAAYVRVDPRAAAAAIRKIRSAWATDEQSGKLSFEMELVEMGGASQPPWQLARGARYPGRWQPAEVYPLPQRAPSIAWPAYEPLPAEAEPPPQAASNASPRLIYSDALEAGQFAFTPPVPSPEAPEGNGTFYLETDETGRVVHLLLLSPVNPTLSRFEHALHLGRARGAVRGEVTVEWH